MWAIGSYANRELRLTWEGRRKGREVKRKGEEREKEGRGKEGEGKRRGQKNKIRYRSILYSRV